jgi:hypothetical protein
VPENKVAPMYQKSRPGSRGGDIGPNLTPPSKTACPSLRNAPNDVLDQGKRSNDRAVCTGKS